MFVVAVNGPRPLWRVWWVNSGVVCGIGATDCRTYESTHQITFDPVDAVKQHAHKDECGGRTPGGAERGWWPCCCCCCCCVRFRITLIYSMDTTGSEQRFIHFTGEVLCVRFGRGGHEGRYSCQVDGLLVFWGLLSFSWSTVRTPMTSLKSKMIYFLVMYL